MILYYVCIINVILVAWSSSLPCVIRLSPSYKEVSCWSLVNNNNKLAPDCTGYPARGMYTVDQNIQPDIKSLGRKRSPAGPW